MKLLLLDTHVFLWWVLDDPRLGGKLRDSIADAANRVYLSAASTWEMVIKARLGKLALPDQPKAFIDRHLRENRFDPLPVTIEHTTSLASLPHIHRDPFDRMLIAQSIYEDMTLVTDDPVIQHYNVRTLSP